MRYVWHFIRSLLRWSLCNSIHDAPTHIYYTHTLSLSVSISLSVFHVLTHSLTLSGSPWSRSEVQCTKLVLRSSLKWHEESLVSFGSNRLLAWLITLGKLSFRSETCLSGEDVAGRPIYRSAGSSRPTGINSAAKYGNSQASQPRLATVSQNSSTGIPNIIRRNQFALTSLMLVP